MFSFFKRTSPASSTTPNKKTSPGQFSVCIESPLKGQHTAQTDQTAPHVKIRYHIILVIFLFTLTTHTWTFFERHILKNTITPIIMVITGFFYDTVFASSPQPAAPSQKQPAATPQPPATPAAAKPEEKKDTESVFDPLSLDEGRVKVLLSLSEREKDLKRWEDLLTSRENVVKALEVQVQKKAEELKELKTVIENLAKSHNDIVSKNIKNLVTIYESMKPQSAAKFFDELPLSVLTELIPAMNPKKTSAIIALMNVDKVKSITDRFALMPQVPEPKK